MYIRQNRVDKSMEYFAMNYAFKKKRVNTVLANCHVLLAWLFLISLFVLDKIHGLA